MLELILKGRPRFYLWLCFLGAIFGLGFIVYIFQANIGLAITGMSRDVSWGLYIAQFTTPAIVTVCEKILGSVIANVTSYHVAILLSLLFTLWCVLVVDRKPAK